MTIYTAFSEVDGLYLGPSASPTGIATAQTSVDEAGVSRAGFQSYTSYSIHKIGQELSEFWIHFRADGSVSNTACLNLLQTGSGTSKLLVSYSTSLGYRFNLVDVGSTLYTIGGNADELVIDLHVKIAEAGFVYSYLNGVASVSYEGDTRFSSGSNTIDAISFSNNTNALALSQIIVSDEPTTFARVYTLPLTADATFDWEGTPTNITGTSFSTNEGALVSGTENDVALFTASTMPAINTDLYEIAAVVMSVNATTQEPIVENKIDFVAKGAGSVVEFGSPQVLDPEAFDHHLFIAETDFVNSGAWTVEKVNALKYGFKSKA